MEADGSWLPTFQPFIVCYSILSSLAPLTFSAWFLVSIESTLSMSLNQRFYWLHTFMVWRTDGADGLYRWNSTLIEWTGVVDSVLFFYPHVAGSSTFPQLLACLYIRVCNNTLLLCSTLVNFGRLLWILVYLLWAVKRTYDFEIPASVCRCDSFLISTVSYFEFQGYVMCLSGKNHLPMG